MQGLQKRLWHRCFPMNFTKSLRTPFSKNTSGGCFCEYTFGVSPVSQLCHLDFGEN